MMADEFPIASILELDLEYRKNIDARMSDIDGCDCPQYFSQRREVLIPEILKKAAERDEDPVEVFTAFASAVHARHDWA